LVVTLHKTAGHPYRVAAGECAVIVALLAVGDISALGTGLLAELPSDQLQATF